VKLAPSHVTFGQACDEQLRYLEHDRQRKPSYVKDCRSIIRCYLLAAFGELTPVENIATSDIDAAATELLSSMIVVAAFTGLRQGELLALRWRHVEFANRILHVRRNIAAGTIEEDTPKSHRDRTVPLSDQALVALDAVSRREHFTGADDLVFGAEVGRHLSDDFAPQRALLDLAARQLGTVGAGNHYVDLFADDQDQVWVGVHFGSRGFGHKTASGFLALAQGLPFDGRASEGEMEAPPTLLATGSDLGQGYIEAMRVAGRYAYAGRDVVCDEVCRILGAGQLEEVHNHHNFAWLEGHDGQETWVVRKGATPAFPGQRGFVGATMGEPAVILEGVESTVARDALYSTVHGAGRAMSRTKAAGKSRKRWACLNRDCDWVQPPHSHKPDACPNCGNDRMSKRWVQETAGAIDFVAVQAELAARGIELRGGAADEAPLAYKRLPDVLAHHAGTVRVLHTLRPIGVAMAGAHTFDPYKD
jgi:tRNA-splicing ligase RtcB (3'-phosphate/5'-hydroxy nucleic acid ligase)